MEQFFPVTRGWSATSTLCTYCGGCSVPRHIYIYIYIYIGLPSSNQIYLDTAYNNNNNNNSIYLYSTISPELKFCSEALVTTLA